MATLRITGVQMRVYPTKAENLPRILNLIERCQSDFIVFPEMALTGYNHGFSDEKTRTAWAEIAATCRRAYVTALVGTGARMDGHTYIQTRIFTDEGALLGTYEKLAPTESDRKWCRPGEELRTFEHGGLKFGCLIGNDLWVTPGTGPYPDYRLSLQLAQRGVDLIFHSANTGTDSLYRVWHEENLKLRAREAGRPIFTVNAVPEHAPVTSPSGVISPEGEWLMRAEASGEHVFTWEMEIE
jgi:predicted amidohydrolase